MVIRVIVLFLMLVSVSVAPVEISLEIQVHGLVVLAGASIVARVLAVLPEPFLITIVSAVASPFVSETLPEKVIVSALK